MLQKYFSNTITARAVVFTLVLLAFSCAAAERSDPHMLGYMEQHTVFYREGGALYFRYESQFDQNLSYVMNPYLKGDGTVAGKNRVAFIDLMDSIIIPYLDIKVNDVPASIEHTNFEFIPKAGMQGGMFTAVIYRVILPDGVSGNCRYFMHDRTHIGDDIDGHSYIIDASVGAEDISISSSTLEISFMFDVAPPTETVAVNTPAETQPQSAPESQPEKAPEQPEPEAPTQSELLQTPAASTGDIQAGLKVMSEPVQTPPPASEAEKPKAEPSTKPSLNDRESATMTDFVRSEKLSIGIILIALGTSLLLGMAHALSPGHGKAMVAAYLVGTRGRVRDAILLGGIVTTTHVMSVIILGLLILLLSQFIVPQRIYPWIGVASGLIVSAVGYWMVASRALGLTPGISSHSHHDHDHDHDHSHDHSHDHGHSHSHVPEGKVTFGSLLTLGIAGGMVPCPSALVVLLLSVAVNRIVFGLAMILVFSLGLAIVLILIGILTVTASRFSGVFSAQSHWIQRLPVFSAGLIMILGVAIAINSLITAGILRFTP